MTPEEQFRRFRDPERWLPLEPSVDPAPQRTGRAAPPAPKRRVAVVTVVVAALLTVGAVAALRFGPAIGGAPAGGATAAPSASASATPAPSPGTVAALPHVDGRLLATWTSDDSALPSGPFDAAGQAIVTTAACTGGGRLSISIPHHSDEGNDCSGASTSGPSGYLRNGRGISETDPITVRVTVTGHPRFAVQLWAVPVASETETPDTTGKVTPTGPDVPASLRTCAAEDFTPVATFSRLQHFQGGVVTVTGAGATDCAIRRYPQVTYRAATGGRQIGAVAAKGGGPSEVVGDAGMAGPAPAVRLVPGGHVYFVATLFLASRFTDASAKECEPVRIGALRVALAPGSVLRVPIPPSPASANCANRNDEANGVSPVVRRLVGD